MKVAAVEETDKATEITKDGKALITITADACWSKRSYKNNYSSLAGVGAIIGVNSGKVLHISVKNKYCVICMRAQNKENIPHELQCNINHKGSSSSMEKAAIVKGFKKSEEYNLIYSKLIADGDSSIYKNILESRPYSNIIVQKIEYSNHLMRNFNGKNIMLCKDKSILLNQLLNSERINRLRIAVRAAVRFRRAQNYLLTEKVKNLHKDIMNIPKHVFGHHSDCVDYYCSPEKKLEIDNVPNVRELMASLMSNAFGLAYHAKSLIYKLNNNRADQLNSVIAKYVGAAVKKFENRKRKANNKMKLWKAKRRLNFIKENIDYGESCQKPDMTDGEYNTEKMKYLENLKIQVADKDTIEKESIRQAESAVWLELKRCLLTASNFGKVCKRRCNVSSALLVKTLLYNYSLDHLPAIQHGKINEATALKQQNIVIHKCGLFIDNEHFFLGASPDAVFSDEIKCPKSAFGLHPDSAIKEKKIRMWKIIKNNVVLNKSHDWYYQVQGQLHITKKDKCLFAVWTGTEHPLKTALIERDDTFWEMNMKRPLLNFYHNSLLPEIVDSRKLRSMPLRNTVL
ncbi:hypothetical protein EVAR_20526_1 [Eumeta japonica]|uniref:YqaJ viral recombinase domain-containing protein n=1 Tax=Eumeta variegata TaxID=151549 RepID=A0A4C1VJL6_EUMVA|nr:hypothetical protein EVAR_20526_1 [Eumeta japonica]